ncbi:MAG: hypothetical protein DI539_22860 [Flavobacterium psychrophilum]|nr:MAG: hypothetical protein DI539_22860 [Flavobacterium psychrophilum]
MALDYEDIERRFDCACKSAVTELSNQYKSTYLEGGPGKLSVFLDLIQLQFDQVEATFVRENELHLNPEALKRIKVIAKNYAKNCLDEYGKISI